MASSNPFDNRYIQDYVRLVEEGAKPDAEYPVCREQIKLIALVESILSEPGVYIDEDKLEKYLGLQKYFPFKLFEWEVFLFTLHCCTFNAHGRPRFPILFLNLGRGAGKNGYLSFEDFCLLTDIHGIKNYNIEICANSEEQAKRSFEDIYWILQEAPDEYARVLNQHFYWNKQLIRNRVTHSELKYRTSGTKSKDSMRSGKIDFDEVHQYTDYNNINTLIGGLGKVPHPRQSFITTNGKVRDGVFDKMFADALDILDGLKEDNGLLPFICRIDEPEEIDDERAWHKANPSLRYMPDLMEEMRHEHRNIEIGLSGAVDFAAKRMNRPKDVSDAEALTSWSNILRASQNAVPKVFSSEKAVAGIDYASLSDFASAVILVKKGDMRYIHTHTWVCRHSVDLPNIKAPLDEWKLAGLLTIVDAPEIPPELIVDWIMQESRFVSLQCVAMDSFRYALLRIALERAGIGNDKIRFVRGADIIKAAPVIESCFNNGLFAFDDNPLFRWYCNNTKRVSEGRDRDLGNWKYGKIEPHSRKNDGFMALSAAMTQEDQLPIQHNSDMSPYMGVYTYD